MFCLACSASYPLGAESCEVDGTPLIAADESAGSTVGTGYVVGAILHSNVLGTCYEAAHPNVPGARFALFAVQAKPDETDPIWMRFRSKAQALRNLKHARIAHVRELGRMPDGRPYVVGVFPAGQPLNEALVGWSGPSPRGAVRLGRQLAQAVAAAHRKAIVHHDLRPENVYVTGTDSMPQCTVFGFGLSMFREAIFLRSAQGPTEGPLAYLAPEQAKGEVGDHRADIYSIGAILFRFVTGREPIHDLEGSVEAKLRALAPDLPEPLVAVIAHAMAPNPADRYAFLDKLDAALAPIDEEGDEALFDQMFEGLDASTGDAATDAAAGPRPDRVRVVPRPSGAAGTPAPVTARALPAPPAPYVGSDLTPTPLSAAPVSRGAEARVGPLSRAFGPQSRGDGPMSLRPPLPKPPAPRPSAPRQSASPPTRGPASDGQDAPASRPPVSGGAARPPRTRSLPPPLPETTPLPVPSLTPLPVPSLTPLPVPSSKPPPVPSSKPPAAVDATPDAAAPSKPPVAAPLDAGPSAGQPEAAEPARAPLESEAAPLQATDGAVGEHPAPGPAAPTGGEPQKRFPQLAIAGVVIGVLVAVGIAVFRDSGTEPAAAPPATVPTATLAPTPTKPPPVTTAAPTASSTADPGSAAEHVKRFFEAMRAARNEDALGDLAKAAAADPTALDIPEARSAVLDLLQRLSTLGSPRASEAFELVGKELGSLGPDLLLEVATTRGGTSAAIHADRLLKDPSVLKLGTEAMRVAYDLRMARSCEQKLLLFQRAREVGDVRSQAELTRIRECHPNAGCCMRDNQALTVLIDAIGARIGWPSTAPTPASTATAAETSAPTSPTPTDATATAAAPTRTSASPPATGTPAAPASATASPDPYD